MFLIIPGSLLNYRRTNRQAGVSRSGHPETATVNVGTARDGRCCATKKRSPRGRNRDKRYFSRAASGHKSLDAVIACKIRSRQLGGGVAEARPDSDARS